MRSSIMLWTAFPPTPLIAPKTEADIPFIIDGESCIAFIHIRTKHFDSHSPALVHKLTDFLNVGNIAA